MTEEKEGEQDLTVDMEDLDLEWFATCHRQLCQAETEAELPAYLVPAFRFMTNPRHRLIRRAGAFVVDSDKGPVRMEGLTAQVSKLFHGTDMRVTTGGQRSGGSARGVQVDRELEALINRGELLDPSSLQLYTVKTLQCLKHKNLQPFWAQCNVFDTQLGIATALDMLCIDTKVPALPGRTNLVNVQLKTGFDKNYNHSNGTCFTSPFTPQSALTRMEDSHHNRHQLQLLCEHMIVQNRYGRPLHSSAIMVISAGCHSLYPLKREFARDLCVDVFANLKHRKSMTPWALAAETTKAQHVYKRQREISKK